MIILAIIHERVQYYVNLFDAFCHPSIRKMNKEFPPLFKQFQELFQKDSLSAAEKVEILEELQALFVKEAQNEEILAELAPSADGFFKGDEDEAEEVQKLEVLRSVFGEGLKEAELKGLVNISEFWEVGPEEVVIKADAQLEGVYFVIGECFISLVGGGSTRPIAFIGLESLFYTSQSFFTVKALGPAKVVLLPKEEMNRVMRLSPHLTHIFAQVFWAEQFFLIEEGFVEKEELANRLEQYSRIFNNLGQALFTIDSKGEIGSFYSSLAATYLEYDEIAGRPFADIILRDNAKGLKSYYRALSLLFSGNHFDPEVIIDLLPSEVELGPRVLKLYYQFAEDKNGYVVAITVRVKDITQELLLQKEVEATEANRQKEIQIQEKIKENIASYLSLIDLIDSNVGKLSDLNKGYVKPGIDPDPSVFSELMTHLHTIKGLSGQFDLSELKTQVHLTESVVQKMASD
ncbi:MAG: cyclic nucleotide-binding domain-containing protein, partial [SAR324 cluster bacterium]|nr:cyclic nucleotide-binding domain-containing protein [SAR324 cluster bacterium]